MTDLSTAFLQIPCRKTLVNGERFSEYIAVMDDDQKNRKYVWGVPGGQRASSVFYGLCTATKYGLQKLLSDLSLIFLLAHIFTNMKEAVGRNRKVRVGT